LSLLVLLDRHGRDALDRAKPADGAVFDPEDLDLRDPALGDAALQLLGRPLADDSPPRDHGDAIAEYIRLEHVVRGQQDRLARLDQAGNRRAQLPGPHW